MPPPSAAHEFCHLEGDQSPAQQRPERTVEQPILLTVQADEHTSPFPPDTDPPRSHDAQQPEHVPRVTHKTQWCLWNNIDTKSEHMRNIETQARSPSALTNRAHRRSKNPMSSCGHLPSLGHHFVTTYAVLLCVRHLVHLHRVVTRTSHGHAHRRLLVVPESTQTPLPSAQSTPASTRNIHHGRRLQGLGTTKLSREQQKRNS